MTRLSPGPQFVARVLAGKSATPAEIASIFKQLYLNKPWYDAYWHFLTQLAHGNLGYDYYNNVPVTTSIKLLRHNLRASLTPLVTQFGLDVGTLIGGAIITEQVFSLPGLGWTAVHAIQSQDLPLIMGIVIIASAGVIVANLLVDIFYAVLDPRVRLH